MRTESFRFFGMNRSKRGNDPYIRVEDSNYRSGTENAGFHQTLRGTILDKYSCFRIASMPPLLPLSHFIGTGYVKNLLAPTASASIPGMGTISSSSRPGKLRKFYLRKFRVRNLIIVLPHISRRESFLPIII